MAKIPSILPIKPLANNLNTAKNPNNLGSNFVGTTIGAREQLLKSAVAVGGNTSVSGANLLSEKSQRGLKENKQFDILGKPIEVSNNILPFGRQSSTSPIRDRNTNSTEDKLKQYSVQRLKEAATYFHDGDLNQYQGNAAKNAIPVGQKTNSGGSRQQQVESQLSQKQEKIETTKKAKQEQLDQRDSKPQVQLPIDVAVPIGEQNVQTSDTVLEVEGSEEGSVISSKKDIKHISAQEVAKALIVHAPVFESGFVSQEKFSNTTFLPDIGEKVYEFYIEIDKEKKEVYNYLLKNFELANSKKWFDFFVQTLNSKINNDPDRKPSIVTLNYQVPGNRFATEKALYFYFNVHVGSCNFNKNNLVRKKLLFKDNYPSTNVEALPISIQNLKVYYKKSKGKTYFTKQEYEESFVGDEAVGQRKSGAAEDGGTLSEQNPIVTAEQKSQTEVEKIAGDIRSSEIHDNTPQGKAIAVGASNNNQTAIAVGQKESTVGILGDHKETKDVGGNHEFQAHSTAMASIVSNATIGSTGAGVLAVGSKLGANAFKGVSSSATTIGGFTAGGAAAVGSSGQGIRGVTGNSIEAYQSGGFQQMGSFGTTKDIGTSNFGNGFGGQKIRGITSADGLRSGQTYLAGGNSDNVLFFAQPGQERELAQFLGFQSPLAGLGSSTIIPLRANGSINQGLLGPAARSALSNSSSGASSTGSGFGGGNKDGKGLAGTTFKTDRNLSGLGGAGNGGGGNGRKLGSSGTFDPGDENNPDGEDDFLDGEYVENEDAQGQLMLPDGDEIEADIVDPDTINKQRLAKLRQRADGKMGSFGSVSGRNFDPLQVKNLSGQRLPSQRVGRSRQGANKANPINNLRQQAVQKAFGNLIKQGVTQAVTAIGGFLTTIAPWLLLAAFFAGLLMVIVIAPYCKPDTPIAPGITLKSFRDNPLEPLALTLDAIGGGQGPLETAANVAKLGFNITPAGLIINAVNGGSTLPSSRLRKAIEALPGCDNPSTNCFSSGTGDLSTGAGNAASIDCFKKQLEGKTDTDKIELWRGQAGVEKAKILPVSFVKKVLSYVGKEGVSTNGVILMLAVAPTESGGNFQKIGGVGNTCYGAMQVCNNEAGGFTFSAFTKGALGKVPTPEEFLADEFGQMKVAEFAFKEKLAIGRFYPKIADKSDIEVASAFWLGACSTKRDGKVKPSAELKQLDWNDLQGRECGGGIPGKDYAEAAARNYKLITCDGGVVSKYISPSQTAYLDTREQDQTNKYWSEAFGFPVLAKMGEQIKRPVLTGLKVLDARILAFNKVMAGKISVEAFVTTGPVLDSEKDNVKSTELKAAIESGKLPVGLSSKDKFLADVEGGLDPLVVKLLLDYAVPQGVMLTALSTKTHRYNVGDKPGNTISDHSYGRAVDFNLQNADDAKKITAVIKAAEAGGMKFGQFGADSGPAALMKAAGFDKTMVDDGPGHLHVELAGGDATITGESGSAEDPCKCVDGSGSNGNVGTSTGPGTVSTGGEFTPAVRAFLDTIAKWEAEGKDTLSKESYSSGNYVANDFDAEASTNLSPPFLKSNGKHPTKDEAAFNVGRYQYFGEWQSDPSYTGFKPKSKIGGDVAAANEGLKKAGINFEIKDFKPTSQDYYPLGKYAFIASKQGAEPNLSKALGKGDEASFKKAVQIGSTEWASMPFFKSSQPKATYEAYYAYFLLRLGNYEKTSSFDVFKLFGGVSADAQNVESNEDNAIRQRVAGYFEKGEFAQVPGRSDRSDIDGIRSHYDMNIVKFLDNAYNAGLSIVTGPSSYGRSSGNHIDPSTAIDIWGVGLLSDIKGKDKIKGIKIGPAGGGWAGGQPDAPANNGNTIDPRIRRHVDTTVDDTAKQLFEKLYDIGFSSGAGLQFITRPEMRDYLKTKGKTQTGSKAIQIDADLKKKDGTNQFLVNGVGAHFHHFHFNFLYAKDKSFANYTGSTASSTSPDCAKKPCPVAPITPTTPTVPEQNGPFPQEQGETDTNAFLNIFSNIKAIAAGAPTSYSSLSVNHLKLLAEVAEALKIKKVDDGGGDKPEMLAAFEKLKTDAAGKGFNLVQKSGYRSNDSQVQTYFQNGQSDKITKFYSDGMSATQREEVKQQYIRRGESSFPPGYSEHNSGLGIDITATGQYAISDNLDRNSYPVKLAQYLAENAPKFGFDLSYGKDSGGANGGAKYEPWHWYFSKSPSKGGSASSGSSSVDCAKSSGGKDLGTNSTLANANPPKNFILTDETGKVLKQIDGGAAVEGASIFKVIVASVVLKKGIDINKQIVLDEKSWLPDEEKYTKNQSVTVSKLLFDMLNDSNNTAANALMNQFGGIGGGFDTVAKEMGYPSVAFGNYFRAEARPVGDNESGKRVASAVDVNSALIDIFKNAGGGVRHSQKRLVHQSAYI
jgi:D-alanyl-D-alanine carboxypeptidase/Beta-lactamase enzyme family